MTERTIRPRERAGGPPSLDDPLPDLGPPAPGILLLAAGLFGAPGEDPVGTGFIAGDTIEEFNPTLATFALTGPRSPMSRASSGCGGVTGDGTMT